MIFWLLLVLISGIGRAAIVSEGSRESGLVVEGDIDLPVHDLYGVVSQFGAALSPAPPSDGTAFPPARLTVHVERQNPGDAPREAEIDCLTRKRETDVRVVVYVGSPAPVEGWLREIVRGLLYRRAAMLGARYAEGSEPPPLPYWIVEGAYQTVTGRNEETFKAVSRRARLFGKVPLVETVIGWENGGEEVPADPVTETWRGAFCWGLYLFYQTAPGHRGDLDRWFASLPGGDVPLQAGKAAEKEWVEFQKTLGKKRDDLVYAWDLYSWDRSQSELEALNTISFPAWTPPSKPGASDKKEADKKMREEEAKAAVALSSKQGRPEGAAVPAPASAPATDRAWEAMTLPLADLPQEAGHPLFAATLRERIDKLIVLEMRANFAWRPVIALERDALMALINPDPLVAATYPTRLSYAATAQARLGGLAGRMTDYVNWFEVNRRSGDEASQGEFGGYFALMGRFEVLRALREK
ncbi:hypothetical protein [Verrucomicrobium sp. GAS474]|uniref:hypothetical protein n=1 Tax=Verrucomicrobium sp. GAS474 TaxID=1882831 RepID=UPI000B82F189|nr:hypothetical protein [Verrucomicrobium sp. GAS474]